jgi:hypothetical protein
MKIFCLFSVDNNYDQPDNNLVCWWQKKPSLEQMFKALEVDPTLGGSYNEANIVAVVKVFSGDGASINETDYRLEEVEEGKNL